MGGLVSVDRELAAAAPSPTNTLRVAAPDGLGERGSACTVRASTRREATQARLRVLRVVDDQGIRRVVVVVDRRAGRGCGESSGHAGPAV